MRPSATIHSSRRSLAAVASLALALGGSPFLASSGWAAEHERNLWPVRVEPRGPSDRNSPWTGAGPFLFRQPNADPEGHTASGFRPFWVQMRNPDGQFRAGYFLYPLFSYTADENTYKWSVFELIRRWDRRKDAGAPTTIFDQRGEFEIFPFWFSRQSGDPDLSYRGLFPIYGTVKNKLGFERLSWTLFPLYVENEKRGAVTTSTPWPIIRVTRGAAHGWGVWPLYHYVERPGVSRHETYLWPLGYNVTRQPHPDDPPGTAVRRDVGALPFYARSTGPGFVNQDYLWPFFGYSDRTAPTRYHERRYFWPFLVQGRGDDRYVNRWGPFYTHSVSKGYDKHWYAWPLVRHAEWTDEKVARTRTQLLYFLYWDEQQRPAGQAQAAPQARLTHVWPLYSRWYDHTGRRQWQLLSPFDVFFPSNYKVRHVWTPFAAIARHEQRAPGESRTSLLWNAVTWTASEKADRSEFHLGPVLGITREGRAQQVTLGNGLLGFRRSSQSGWRVFWWDFPRKSVTSSPADPRAP